jgi:Nuclease-related domain.
MAKVIKGDNHLKQDIDMMDKKVKEHNMNVFKYVGLGFLGMFSPYLFVITMIYFCLVELRDRSSLVKEYEIKKSGYKGESESIQLFSELPDTYTVITDLEVTVDGKTSQIDTVIVGANGIFVCEIKNINGTISGEANDTNLIQKKVSKNGGQFSKEIYNPIKQVSTHVYRLSSVLKNNGYNLWLQGTVLFINPETEVLINNQGTIPVFSSKDGKQEIIDYMLSVGNNQMPLKDREKIIDIISQFVVKN